MKANETKRPKIGVAVFIYREGTFLATKRIGSHGANTWSIPGGHLEFGESWEQCARRETMEETGMDITNVRFLATTNDLFEAENKHYVTIWMAADWQAKEPEIMEPEKMLDLQWVDFANLPQPLFEPCWQNLRAVRPELFA
jgi:8-oxo-dGTP diphosphatase